MEEAFEKPLRPRAITVICVIGFIGVAFSVLQFFVPKVQQIGAWYLPYLGGSLVVQLLCLVGLWHMKRWAVFAYAGFVLLNQLVLYTNNLWEVKALILPAVVVLLLLKYLPKMS